MTQLSKRWLTATVWSVAAVLLNGCGGNGNNVRAGAPEEFAGAALAQEAAQFGSCQDPDDLKGDWPPARETMVDYTDAWLLVDLDSINSFLETSPASIAQVDMEANSTVDAAVSYANSATDIGTTTNARLSVHQKFTPGMRWAADNRAEAFLRVLKTEPGDDRGYDYEVGGALIRNGDGAVFFAGSCVYERLFLPLNQEWGSEFDVRASALIGKTGDALGDALGIEPPQPPLTTAAEDRNLAPDEAPDELLKSLDTVMLHFDYPDSWITDPDAGPWLAIATRISDGWNGGIMLDRPAAEHFEIDAYLNESRLLEVWVLRYVGDTTTKQKLGEVTVPADASLFVVTLTGDYDTVSGEIVNPTVKIATGATGAPAAPTAP